MTVSSKTTWEEDYEPGGYPHLKGDLEVDVAIVGGGIAGILAAYLARKEGKSVALLESGEIGAGVTMATTAFLTSSVDTDAVDLIPMYGRKGASLVRESHEAAISLIERIAEEEGIDCEFVRTPNYFFANGPKDRDALQEEFEAMKELGYDAVLDTRLDTGFENAGGIELRNQAKFHPVKFLQQLAKRASEQGVQVFERARVESVSGEGPFVLKVGRHSVKAPRVAIMTYQPLENPWQVFAKKGMYVSYVFEVEIPAGIIAEGTYEDTDNPYHYFRVDRGDGKDRLIIGGEDHREEIPLPAHKSRAALREYLETLMDGRPYTIVRQWSGPILEPADGLALIGDVAPGHFVATAFSGNGMTYAGIAALMLADAIGGRTGPWAKLYDPKRWPTPGQLMRKGRDYAAELIFGAGRNLFR